MKMHICLLALTSFVLGGCVVHETVPVTTTTTVTREVTTTGPATTGPGVTREVVVTRTPPTVRVETQTVSPGPNYVWTRGYWKWNGATYRWIPGGWVVRPRPAAVWVEGHWQPRSGGWVWVPGHWR